MRAGERKHLWQSSNYNTWIVQDFVIEGLAAKIDAGDLEIDLSGWFGGPGAEVDAVVLQAHYLTAAGGPVPSLVTPTQSFDQTDPVTPAERNNVTDLLHRQQRFVIPPMTRRLEIRLASLNIRTGGNEGLADNVAAVLIDRGLVVDYPGTGEDLVLSSGINGTPTSGPSEDIKSATAGDVLSLVVASPGARFHYAPLLLAAQVASTGYIPQGIPNFPGGTPWAGAVPPGAAGISLFVQGLALTSGSANGVYAATDAHEIRIQ